MWGIGTVYSAAGKISCADAPAGSFVDTIGATSATPCGLGTFQPSSGQASCADAPPGSFVDTTGASSATPCGLGTFQSGSGQASCIAAPIGSYVNTTGATAPTACPSGMTTLTTGSTSINACRFPVPTTIDQCKDGGWQQLADANGTPFKNQGDCVSYVATDGRNPANG
jgi:ephrin receptor-like protein